MEQVLREHIENAMGQEVSSAVHLSGGDIAIAMRIQLGDRHCFCKYQKGGQGYPMLKAERTGLEAIGATGHIRTPAVLHLGKLEGAGCLILEYIEARTPRASDMFAFGEKLARLHTVSNSAYGWDTDNFIGSLPQSNRRTKGWAEFYTSQRLIPQLRMSLDRGLLDAGEIPPEETLEARIKTLCPSSRPALVHGDLWGGNFLIAEDGEPCLIDPSVSYSHPGVDIAMSRLFGGFSESFYRGYEEASLNPMPERSETDLYQLYYLLVHLNIFGASYASSVRNILRRYF